MLADSIKEVSALIVELREAMMRMEERGERVPLEVEEKVHLIHEHICDMAAAVQKTKDASCPEPESAAHHSHAPSASSI
jgi:hypothetical protein